MTKKSLWKYHYTITDHLGNTRVEFVSHNGSLPEVVQSVSYYPFGYTLRCNDYGSRQPNRHLFGGKELQDQTLAGITFGWYDFETRMYDPSIGRFMQTDPMAEKYYWISPYAYCANNPIKFIDPTGMKIEPLDKEEQEAYEAFRKRVFDGGKKYKKVKKELIKLEEADEVFCIRMGDNITSENGGGNFIYNKETGQFDVNISNYGDFNTDGKLAHELKHAYQYLEGKLGFDISKKNNIPIVAYDINDEYEAYNRQALFGETLSNEKIDIKYNKLPFYKTNKKVHDLKTGVYNIDEVIKCNSTSFKAIGQPVILYHDWKKDIVK